MTAKLFQSRKEPASLSFTLIIQNKENHIMNEPENRNYPNSKVYHDGSHYIAIPQRSFPSGKGIKKRHTATTTPEQIERKERFENAYTESKELPYEQRA